MSEKKYKYRRLIIFLLAILALIVIIAATILASRDNGVIMAPGPPFDPPNPVYRLPV